MNINVGGSASDGGFQFQAKIIAYVAVHILAKQVLTGLEYDIQGLPTAVAAETNGPGDDIRIEFTSPTRTIEIQAKKGLRIDNRFNEALEKIASGLRQNPVSSVVLAVDSTATSQIRQKLPYDLQRLRQGREDIPYDQRHFNRVIQCFSNVTGNVKETEELLKRFIVHEFNLEEIQAGQVQRVLYLLRSHVVDDEGQAKIVWNLLIQAGHKLITNQGRYDTDYLVQLIRTESDDSIHLRSSLLATLKNQDQIWLFPTAEIVARHVSLQAFDVRGLLAGQLAESSIAMYKRDVAAYVSFAHEQGLEPLYPLTLAAWRDHLALDSEMSPNTINRMLSAVKRIIKQAASKELVDEAISFKFQNIEGVKVKALKNRLKQHGRTRISPEDMRTLCQVPDGSTLLGKRDRALLATLATSGLRASELATLTREQIKPRGKGYYLQVIGKTDTEPRDAHLSVEAYSLIQEWLDARPVVSSYIFTSFSTRAAIPHTTPISEVTVWNIVQKYAAQCGLEHIKPHDFRRFVGTQLASKDIRKAQLALGHKSIEVTARHYVLDELEIGLTDNLY